MVITEAFVFIHFPKCGGTFVTKSLQALHETRVLQRPDSGSHLRNLQVQNLHWKETKRRTTQHGTCRQIPSMARSLPIMTVIRNPLDRLVSLYEFRDWERNPPAPVHELLQQFPQYPKLSLTEYYQLSQTRIKSNLRLQTTKSTRIGIQSLQFLMYFAKNPNRALRKVIEQGPSWRTLRSELYPCAFLKMDNLNNQLASYLEVYGYTNSELSIVRNSPTIRPEASVKTPGHWSEKIDQELQKLVQEDERLLFELFPDYKPQSNSWN